MSDGFYALFDALACLALIAVLYFRWRQGRALRALMKSLDEQRRKNDPVE